VPRNAPDQVVEHRVTLGDFERREIKQTLDALDRRRNVQAIQDGVTAAAYLATGAGVAWLGYQTWLIVNPPEDQFKNPAGANLWSNVLYRAGVISRDEMEARVTKATEQAQANDGKKPSLWRWVLFGNDDKFFLWEV
jgi:hypothetical protein